MKYIASFVQRVESHSFLWVFDFNHVLGVVIRNWCCSFDIFSYETVVWLPSLSCAMALKLTSKGLETFSSCLLYTCETAYYKMMAAVKREHHLPGQCSISAHWTAQNRRPFLSTRGWAGESSRQWISSKAAFDCSISSQVWVCKRLTLASVVQHHRLSWRNHPAQFFCSNFAEPFIPIGV